MNQRVNNSKIVSFNARISSNWTNLSCDNLYTYAMSYFIILYYSIDNCLPVEYSELNGYESEWVEKMSIDSLYQQSKNH